MKNKLHGLKFILLLVMLNSGSAQQNFGSLYAQTINSNISFFENQNNSSKKILTDIRVSIGGGMSFLYGNKYSSLNAQSLLNKNFTIAAEIDYYFIKNKEEKQLKNFFSPALLILYNAGVDRSGNEILFGGGITYHDFNKIKPLITLKGNLYLQNNFYLGLEIRQPFTDAVFESAGSSGIFISPYIGVNLFYKITN